MTEEERLKTLAKLNRFRKDLRAMDWSDDKMFTGTGRPYGYVSADKVKSLFGALAVEHGLETQLEFSELQTHAPMGMMTQHWSLKATMTLIDIDTGESIVYSAYGEAGDAGDKGVNKAQTDALKQVVFNAFMTADNSADDPDASSVDTVPTVMTKYRPKSELEEAQTRANVLSAGIPAPKAPKPGVPSPVKIMPKAQDKGDIPEVLAKALRAIVTRASLEVMDGTKTASELDVLKGAVEAIQTKAEAERFIQEHQA